MGRVAIRAEDHLPRQHKRLLAQNLVTNASPHFKEAANALLLDEPADLGMVLRVAGRRRGYGMVERDREFFRNHNPLLSELQPGLANGRAVVVAQNNVRPDVHDFADLNRF